ncbi:efflux RND transporter permease subunit [Acidocella aromatica]|uniref:Efflux pump membrane transporter n=1 Tax=Acidocella aromatica TaxID=1303579 RepID=A0A840VKX9_9PROT|nr:efflux RND transporter permease subunit [Acidocella aromatica]MBB5372221.1 multidrug efflux pump [Acidocella aromatica]
MSRFFIDRPVFAWVLALILMLGGAIAAVTMAIAQYPSIAPPQIAITGTYAGASAQTVTDTVVRPILQQMNGLDGLEYISASTQSSGAFEVDLTFVQGTDPNIAQVQVQNKLSLAEPNLPSEVSSQGLRVVKATKNYMLIIGVVSTDGSMSSYDISDYIASKMRDSLTRIPGVGDYVQFGSEYAMRIWVDPGKLYNYGLTVPDVVNAVAEQNVQVPAGELGGLPATGEQRLDATIIGPARFESPQQFENILLKVEQSGAQVRLKDVARVELGADSYSIVAKFTHGEPVSGLALKLAPGANQLTTEAAVKAEVDVLAKNLPPGLKVIYPMDTEPYILLSIEEVLKTLLEAIALVFVVMLIFLQNFRATLIPTIAVPVVLLGTFIVLSAMHYSINTLTMLAMVLAVGLLVDDAIVVVENVDRLMHERGLSPKEAARQSMDEISGALVGIALVLSAVFLPMAFFGGSTGVIYRQFSVTIITAMTLSVLVALIFTPALCATLLKPPAADGSHGAKGFAGWFNRGFDATRRRYLSGVGHMARRLRWSMVGFIIITGLAVLLFSKMPTGFLPDEDQGMLYGQIILPPGSTAAQTTAVNKQLRDYLQKNDGSILKAVFTVAGFNFAGQEQSQGLAVIRMQPWDQRPDAWQSVSALAARVNAHFAGSRDARIIVFQPPPVLELGNATGFDLELENVGNLSHQDFLAARNQFLGMAMQDKLLTAVRPNGLDDAPQFQLNVDREKAEALGLSISDVNTTIQGALASEYVNQFMYQGRVKHVYVQGAVDSRMLPSDLGLWYVRNSNSNMVPFDAFVSGSWTTGPEKVETYNGQNAFEIQGQPAPGVSSGAAMAEIQKLVAKLPPGVNMEWTGLSYEQVKAGAQTGRLYAISVVVVLLCLAALYESWAIPAAVMMVVPLGILGAIMATLLRGLANDVYFQVGLLTTMGLATKNAILIVEFAKAFYEQGETLAQAALHAAQERLRPILMTSIAFVFGTFPLAIATGAGASSRVAIGTAVVGGMVTATVLAIFFVPVFFIGVLKFFKVQPRKPDDDAPAGGNA